ncbi:ABC transporter permease [Thermoanaerobaculum aquaticum]|uniref:ABC transporter permease n=1 Tax=Thermoanaerobaculum aquaticum TaxID=1312852 RepID=UPI0006A6E351|nr:ABC transporter permease [Thermoanaerobaculum aquaticum]
MGFFREIWLHRRLVLTLAGRAVKARYAGSVLGLAWAILEPLLQFALFLVVFGIFLGLRGLAPAGGSFALWLLAGLIPFLLLQEGWVRAAGVFRAHAGLVKHVPVPLSVLLLSELLAVLARHGVMMALFVVAGLVRRELGVPGLAFLLAGLLVVLLFLVGGSLFLSIAGSYLPDVVPVTSTVMSFFLYATPILYPVRVVPAQWQVVFLANPLWGVTEVFRLALGGEANVRAMAVSLAFALVLFVGGMVFFGRRQSAPRDLV